MPDDRQAVFAGVLLLANRMQTSYDKQLGALTLKQWLALVIISVLPQPVASTAVLTPIIGTSHQNVSKLVEALASKGFLAVEPSTQDRRARQVSLTPAGRAYLAANERQGADLLAELFDGVSTEDVATCLRVLNAMSRTLTGVGLTPAAPAIADAR